MHITSLFLLLLLSKLQISSTLSSEILNTTSAPNDCPEFGTIPHGTLREVPTDNDKFEKVLQIVCNDGYDLATPSKIVCQNGQWLRFDRASCEARCRPPPFIENGYVEIEDGNKDDFGLYKKGTLATYICEDKFELSPPESKYRVCEKGIWTGPLAKCEEPKKKDCEQPKEILNGYFVIEMFGGVEGYGKRQRVHYSCKEGFWLNGSSVQICLEDGSWSPRSQPSCGHTKLIAANVPDHPREVSCPPPPRIPHTKIGVIQEMRMNDKVTSITVKVDCAPLYRDISAPCGASNAKLQCINGKWVGTAPNCVPVRDCVPPPRIPYGTPFSLNLITYLSGTTMKYPLKAEISYECLPGYELEGNEVLTCNPNGCWVPETLPICRRSSDSGYFDLNETNAILVSAATGAGVLGLLLIICLTIVCKKKKPLRASSLGVPPPPDLGDHAVLIRQPDRLALIAFAEGLQQQQQSSALPTYEEATRDRGVGFVAGRLQRPHWPSLGVRRSRNPEIGHVTRQGSFASHTPSLRSDPMGSTDTVAVSEGSTTVTLDTASSHSGSHAASSCRVHCGSLASFDTSSILNTDGVPLLEENELEEVLTGSALVAENLSMAEECISTGKVSAGSPD